MKASSNLSLWRRNPRQRNRAATEPFVIITHIIVMSLSILFLEPSGLSQMIEIDLDNSVPTTLAKLPDSLKRSSIPNVSWRVHFWNRHAVVRSTNLSFLHWHSVSNRPHPTMGICDVRQVSWDCHQSRLYTGYTTIDSNIPHRWTSKIAVDWPQFDLQWHWHHSALQRAVTPRTNASCFVDLYSNSVLWLLFSVNSTIGAGSKINKVRIS